LGISLLHAKHKKTSVELKMSLSKPELPKGLKIDYYVKIQWSSSG